MKKKVLLTFILLIICISSFTQTADDYFQRGLDKYYRHSPKDVPGAIHDFTKALNLAPDSSLILIWRAKAKSDLEDYRGAIQDYKKAIKTGYGRNLHHWYFNIGFNYMEIKKYKEAIRFFNKAIEYRKKSGFFDNSDPTKIILLAFYNRGLAKIYMGNKEEGCLDLSKVGEMGYEEAYKTMQEFCNN